MVLCDITTERTPYIRADYALKVIGVGSILVSANDDTVLLRSAGVLHVPTVAALQIATRAGF
jgi:hypothetical protein